ncbi:MAG: phosphopantothenate/pantothenate synthetase [Candidatus Altiarchaeota archaeon]|nr:phosphopantothenate/pantothenate synthetase [Candidatus Altiarchaeota archaeon]
MKIPESHPRYESLMYRQRIVEGLRKGYVAEAGLIAHGRGEAFDYLLGERTAESAYDAERAAVAAILLSNKPVFSVNGNTAALVAAEIVSLAKVTGAGIEVNLFHRTDEREKLIEEILKELGTEEVLGVGEGMEILPHIESARARADPGGIWVADTVLVCLEDGDRTEALVKMNKCVVSVDLNPLSRTSQYASIPVVDNVVRAVPNMIELAGEMLSWSEGKLRKTLTDFNEEECLERMISLMRKGF